MTPPRILIVDDEPLIAFAIEDALIEAGFAIAGVAANVGDALAIVESGICDGAILDANLFGVSVAPVAEALAARGVRYLVLSGYDAEYLPVPLQGASYLQKPVKLPTLISTLNGFFPKS